MPIETSITNKAAPAVEPQPAVAVAPAADPTAAAPSRREPTFLQVFTLVLWLTCLIVGLLGIWLQRQAHPAAPLAPPPPPEPPVVQAELIQVPMAPQPKPAEPPPPQPADAPPPPAEPPALPAVAAPSPSIAFSIPVEGPVRIVPFARASAARAEPVRAPVVEHLELGHGTAASQPRPDYPPDAVAAHEEGVVLIEFSVAPGGKVAQARVVRPSPWPSLNDAALSVVRDEWADPRWQPGHLYQVPIRFHLRQQ